MNKDKIIKKGVIIYNCNGWEAGVKYCGVDNQVADERYKVGYGCKYYYNIPNTTLNKIGDLFHELIEVWNTPNNYENNIINEQIITNKIDELGKKYE